MNRKSIILAIIASNLLSFIIAIILFLIVEKDINEVYNFVDEVITLHMSKGH